MEALFKDEAIVLKKTEVGDTDLSILVYMKHMGKENIYIPKGQIIKSFFPTITEPLNWFKGVFYKKKNKVFIKEVDLYKNLALPISQDLEKVYTAFFILSNFNRYVLFNDEKLFIFLKKSLYYLNKTKNVETFKINFLAKLIFLSGIYPELSTCVSCGKKVNKKNYGSLSLKESGILCKNCIADPNRFLDYNDILDLKILKGVPFNKLDKIRLKNPLRLEIFLQEYLSKKL